MRRFPLVALLALSASCGPSARRPDYALLAPFALLSTPEHESCLMEGYHAQEPTEQQRRICAFESGRRHYAWCVFVARDLDAFAELAAGIRVALGRKYKLYRDESEIPEGDRHYMFGTLAGYSNGFVFRVRAEAIDTITVKITYSDYRTGLAASSHWELYKWDGSVWVLTEVGPLGIS